jgi:phage gp37-like protein
MQFTDETEKREYQRTVELENVSTEELVRLMVKYTIALLRNKDSITGRFAAELTNNKAEQTRLGLITDCCIIPYGNASVSDVVRSMMSEITPAVSNDIIFRDAMIALIIWYELRQVDE